MNLSEQQTALQKASQIIRNSKHLVAFTGAGISTPSGIPDFRSQSTGMWNRFDPLEVASLTAFRHHPEKFYGWIGPLYAQLRSARPNPAHLGLARLETAGKLKAVITQNIDNLHQAAGSQTVIEVHGSLKKMICMQCEKLYATEKYVDGLLSAGEFPRCPVCHSCLKPDIVLYEEMLPEPAWTAALEQCGAADVIWVIGSSLEVTPAAHLPLWAVKAGARLIINNFSPTPLDQAADVILPYDLAVVVPEIVERCLE